MKIFFRNEVVHTLYITFYRYSVNADEYNLNLDLKFNLLSN
jgi:hypothetical protein